MSGPLKGIERIPSYAIGCMHALAAEVSRAGMTPYAVSCVAWSRHMRDFNVRTHVLVYARDRIGIDEVFCAYPDDTAAQIADEVRDVLDQYDVYGGE